MGGIYMKKTFLIPFALLFLLTGCLTTNVENEPSNNSGDNQQQETNDNGNNNQNNDDQGGQESGDNNTPDESNDDETGNTGGDNGEVTPPDEGGDEPNIPDTAVTKTITFLNNTPTSSSLHNNENSREQFVTWFNQSADGILNSISVGGFIQVQYIGNEKDSWRFSTLTLSSASNDGSLTFNFSKNIYKVKFNIQGYCKYIEYSQSYNVDTSSVFHLDDDDYDLSVSPGYTDLLEKQDVEKSYSTPTKSLTISSTGGRVFVHSMEITYSN